MLLVEGRCMYTATFLVIMTVSTLIGVQSQQFKLLKKSEKMSRGWRLANIKDVEELNANVKNAFKKHAFYSSPVDLADGYLESERNTSPIKSKLCNKCEWKLVIRGGYKCSFRSGWYARSSRIVGDQSMSNEQCFRNCTHRKRYVSKTIIGVSNGQRCKCAIEMIERKGLKDGKGCFLIPKRAVIVKKHRRPLEVQTTSRTVGVKEPRRSGITTQMPRSGNEGSSNIGLYIGIVVIILIVIFIAVLIILKILKHRKRKTAERKREIAVGDSEDTERLTGTSI